MRKLKFHLTNHEGSGWSICGQNIRDDDGTINRGVHWNQLKSKCKITCKNCRKSWYFTAGCTLSLKKTGYAA